MTMAPYETEDSESSAALRHQVAQFEAIHASLQDAVYIVDTTGVIVYCNPALTALTGYGSTELLQRPSETLYVPEVRDLLRARRFQAFAGETRLPPLETFLVRQDQSYIPVELVVTNFVQAGQLCGRIAVVRDIRERKRAEQRLLESLHEKEMLLKEIHHRVKNNLAVISSLLYLQSIYTQDEPTLKMLRESQDRIRSMSLVHEAIYRSENFAAVDFADYVGALSQQLLRTYSLSGNIQLKTDLEPVYINLELAIPCGLILNELITNALKHAFPAGQAGEIRVTLRQYDTDGYSLQVADNGVGLPDALAVATVTSLGMRLIRILTRQIDGQFELVATHPGTEARLTLGAQRDAEQA